MIAGYYRDVLLDRGGRVTWADRVRKNVVVADCRRLLTGFLHGSGTAAAGITGLQVGKGDPAWDLPAGPPPVTASQAALVDRHPFTVPRTSLRIDYLTGSTVTAAPTNKLQIVATLGPGVPDWPDTDHTDATLREFGLVGALDGATVLIDYVIHPAIPRDRTSTLQRTIWLVL
ncbi:hypothetical protein amrb99_59190 [Actinomadura sp. RB99]|uniref:hypothetical protein n=1 Tax=Actinomadura sp. RB99 TaxID=2691577 RepID=UPI0016841A13|nr:hypothetical protein [Actinomadura sp. RB99]MBD2896966.1 hypothetical protein [Actinomadura sp. RB99]